MHRRLTALSILIVLAVPASAAAKTETAASGPVEATISYTKLTGQDAYGYRDFRVRIVRSGQELLERPLDVPGCQGDARFCSLWPGGFEERQSVRVTDLDGDSEPEVLVDGYTGGAHCCQLTFFFRFESGRYTEIHQDFRDYGYELRDLNGDGRPELDAFDIRFIDAYTAHAASAAPIRVLRYDRGRLLDVTRSFKPAIRRDAAVLRREYRRIVRRRQDGRGFLAAYVADLYRLGRGREARAALNRAVARREFSFAKGFRRRVLRDLHRWGYR